MLQNTSTRTLGIEPSAKAERTRAAILAAAEQQFARRGFVATRLEDVAAAVNLKRAALFYHFKDKQSLYDAVIAAAFGSLATRLQQAFDAPESSAVRVERALEAWVDTILERPTLARLMLRHAAEADDHGQQGLFASADEFTRIAWALFDEARKAGEFKPIHDDPFHAASAVIGATVFYVAAFGPLVPGASVRAQTSDDAAAHKDAVLRTLRLLLGIPAPKAPKPRPRKRASAAAKPSRRRLKK